MNQETRNKKNAKYQQNLQKRYGLTKSSDYKVMSDKGISLSENIKKMTKEFVMTRRHGVMVSKEIQKYQWSPEATAIKKEIAEQRNHLIEHIKTGIPYYMFAKTLKVPPMVKDKSPITIEERQKGREQRKQNKIDAKEKLPLSKERDKFFGKPSDPLKRAAEEATHEAKITKLIQQLKEQKMSKHLRNIAHRPFKVVIATNNDNNFKIKYSNLDAKKLNEIATKLNNKLSSSMKDYKSISIIDRSTGEMKMLYKAA